MNYLPVDLITEATRGMCEDCQKSFRNRLNKLIAEEKPEQPPAPQPEKPRRELPILSELTKLLREVAARHRLPVEALRNGGSQWRLVIARREFCKLARERGYFLTDIGKAVHRHHTSVYYLARGTAPKRQGAFQ